MDYSEVFSRTLNLWREFLMGRSAIFIEEHGSQLSTEEGIICDIQIDSGLVIFITENDKKFRVGLDFLQIQFNNTSRYLKIYNTNLEMLACVEFKFD